MLNKINVLLDDNTIVNFGYLLKVFKRYKRGALALSAIVVLTVSYFYSQQLDIYYVSINFQNMNRDGGRSANSEIAKIIGESTSSLRPDEIQNLHSQQEFVLGIGKYLVDDKRFGTIDFNNKNTRTPKDHGAFFRSCDEKKKCLVERAGRLAANMVSIKEDDVLGRYVLIVSGLHADSTRVIAEYAAKVIDETRLKDIKYFVLQQQKITEGLMKEKKKELEAAKYFEKKAQLVELELKIGDITNPLNTASFNVSKIKLDLDNSKTVLDQARRVSSELESKDYQNQSVKISRARGIQSKIVKLEDNLKSIIEKDRGTSLEKRSIISIIRKEIRKLKSDLAKMGPVFSSRKEINKISFIQDQELSEVQRTHQYTIAKKNYESELAKLKSLQEIKRDLSKKRSLLKSEIDKHASGIQYYRVLNSKLSSLRLRASTVVTDIVFDKLIPQVSSFKKFALSLFISLSIALSLFLSNLYVISSFLLDKRIYDEVELKSTFNDIEIIGDTPEFE